MRKIRSEPKLARGNVTQGVGVAGLVFLAGWIVAGPSGLLAWSENNRLLEQRRAEVATLTTERDELKNRVALLDPAHADPDLAGELLRSNLNVVHPDEVVLLLNGKPARSY